MTDSKGLAVQQSAAIVEKVVIGGDLSSLTPVERVAYYKMVCESIGVNPLTQPFGYLLLDGKLVLYPKRDCTDQLRDKRHISAVITARERVGDIYVVTARATTPDGRSDESIGAVPLVREGGAWQSAESGKRFFKADGTLVPLPPVELANAMMKAETKAKRRVTLSISGLGMMDETEVETVSSAKPVAVDMATGEVKPAPASNGQDDSDKPFKAWFADREHQQKFFAGIKKLGLSSEDVHTALNVTSLSDLADTVTLGQVRDAIKAYQKPIFEDEPEAPAEEAAQ